MHEFAGRLESVAVVAWFSYTPVQVAHRSRIPALLEKQAKGSTFLEWYFDFSDEDPVLSHKQDPPWPDFPDLSNLHCIPFLLSGDDSPQDPRNIVLHPVYLLCSCICLLLSFLKTQFNRSLRFFFFLHKIIYSTWPTSSWWFNPLLAFSFLIHHSYTLGNSS